jgi:hypothetical protein
MYIPIAAEEDEVLRAEEHDMCSVQLKTPSWQMHPHISPPLGSHMFAVGGALVGSPQGILPRAVGHEFNKHQ